MINEQIPVLCRIGTEYHLVQVTRNEVSATALLFEVTEEEAALLQDDGVPLVSLEGPAAPDVMYVLEAAIKYTEADRA